MARKLSPEESHRAKFNPKEIQREIQDIYLQDGRPWIVGFSGGKDSTTVLQLIFYALLELPEKERRKHVYVLSSDTLVETPPIIAYIDNTMDMVQKAAQKQGLPMSAVKVKPLISETFWVNLIGKGYPSPSPKFRWCTDRMKIQPANRFILEQISKSGEVIMILGIRRSESATRAQAMSLYSIEGQILRRHSSLPNAYVYAPIEHLSLDDVWTYLLQVPSPWGSNNRNLVTLYRNAQSGECPLVIDTTTPSCGNSRFGCWVCTVVQQDKAMEGFIDNGEEWMEPMLEFREWLAEIRNDRNMRSYKRRNGQTYIGPDGKPGPGPFTLDARRIILRRLLKTQKKVGIPLILPEELHEIRRIWRMEEQDWEDSVPLIVKEIGEKDFVFEEEERPFFGSEEEQILRKICEEEGVSVDLVKKLLDVERDLDGVGRRHGLYDRIEAILSESWLTEDQISGLGSNQEISK